MAGDGKEETRKTRKELTSKDMFDLFTEVEKMVKNLEENSRLLPSEVSHKERETSEIVICNVQCDVRGLGEIDTVKQTFKVEVRLRFRWREDKFVQKEDITRDDYWDPRINFPNAVTIDERERKYFTQYFQDLPYACLSIRMKAVFKTDMQLQRFPSDHQALTIKVMSDWPENMIQFQKDDKLQNIIHTSLFTETHEWNLYDHLTTSGEEDKTNTYPVHTITIHVRRKVSYYVWNIALVITLILLSNFSSIAVTVCNPKERLSVSVILLLTAVTFKSVVSSSLPKIPYLTLMDIYVLWSLFIQCCAVFQNAVAVMLVHICTSATICIIFDWASVGALLVAVLVLNLYFIIGVTERSSSQPTVCTDARAAPSCQPTVPSNVWAATPDNESGTLPTESDNTMSFVDDFFERIETPDNESGTLSSERDNTPLNITVTEPSERDNISHEGIVLNPIEMQEKPDLPVIPETVTEKDIP